jgi:hypothetical protein
VRISKEKERSAKTVNHRWDRRTLLELLRRRVELLAELRNVDTALAKRRADRRRRIGLPRRHLEFDVTVNLFRHRS